MARETNADRMKRQERELAELRTQMQAMMAGQAQGAALSRQVAVGAQFQQVGIRNVSSYTVGITSPVKGEPDVQLTSHDPRNPNPESATTISWPFWQAIRKGPYLAKGYLVRDDSLLGDTDLKAPEDSESDLPPERLVNTVVDPWEWIDSRTEEEIRQGLADITSEATVRRLLWAIKQRVDQEVIKFAGDPDRLKKGTRNVPVKWLMTEELARERLDDIRMPNVDRSQETRTVAKF